MSRREFGNLEYVVGAMRRIGQEIRQDTVYMAYIEAEKLLIQMYKEKGNVPVPPGWDIKKEVLDRIANDLVKDKNLRPSEVQSFCDAFTERFSQGYPNYVI